MKINTLLLIALLLFSVSVATAQISQDKIIVEHISPYVNAKVDDPGDPRIKVKNLDREATLEDIVDGIKEKKKVTIVLLLDRRSSHAISVVGVNTTPRYVVDAKNLTWKQNDIMFYDPQFNKTYNTTITRINGTNTTYIFYDEWKQIITVHRVYKSPFPIPPKIKRTQILSPFLLLAPFCIIRRRDLYNQKTGCEIQRLLQTS